jgi:hypothetical protein
VFGFIRRCGPGGLGSWLYRIRVPLVLMLMLMKADNHIPDLRKITPYQMIIFVI